jgi:hypothetical protein
MEFNCSIIPTKNPPKDTRKSGAEWKRSIGGKKWKWNVFQWNNRSNYLSRVLLQTSTYFSFSFYFTFSCVFPGVRFFAGYSLKTTGPLIFNEFQWNEINVSKMKWNFIKILQWNFLNPGSSGNFSDFGNLSWLTQALTQVL